MLRSHSHAHRSLRLGAALRAFGRHIIQVMRDMDAARGAAAAVRVRAHPREADLRRLGIDPVAFRRVRRF